MFIYYNNPSNNVSRLNSEPNMVAQLWSKAPYMHIVQRNCRDERRTWNVERLLLKILRKRKLNIWNIYNKFDRTKMVDFADWSQQLHNIALESSTKPDYFIDKQCSHSFPLLVVRAKEEKYVPGAFHFYQFSLLFTFKMFTLPSADALPSNQLTF